MSLCWIAADGTQKHHINQTTLILAVVVVVIVVVVVVVVLVVVVVVVVRDRVSPHCIDMIMPMIQKDDINHILVLGLVH